MYYHTLDYSFTYCGSWISWFKNLRYVISSFLNLRVWQLSAIMMSWVQTWQWLLSLVMLTLTYRIVLNKWVARNKCSPKFLQLKKICTWFSEIHTFTIRKTLFLSMFNCIIISLIISSLITSTIFHYDEVWLLTNRFCDTTCQDKFSVVVEKKATDASTVT